MSFVLAVGLAHLPGPVRAAAAMRGTVGAAEIERRLAPPEASVKRSPPTAGAPKTGIDAAAEDDGAPPGGNEAAATPAQGTGAEGHLVLPALAVTVRVLDGEGREVARVGPSAAPVDVVLPAGGYTLVGPSGARVTWTGGDAMADVLPAGWRASPPAPAVVDGDEERGSDDGGDASPRRESKAELDVRVRATWRRALSPVMAALVPGSGHMMNGQTGRGTAILLSTAGLIAGTVLLWPRPDPHEGTGGRNDDTRPAAEEVARLAAFGAMSGTLGLLYAGQIFDAYQVATGEPARPRTDFRMRIEVAGMYTIAARPGQPSHGLLRDFNVSFMFQPVRRFTIGFADIGGGRDRSTGRRTSQAGLRLGYRVYGRRRTWVTLSLGGVFQSAGRDAGLGARGAFGGFLYAQMGIRIFVTRRVSIGVVPRFSFPVATRFYSFGGSTPRFAPSLELGGGIGTHF